MRLRRPPLYPAELRARVRRVERQHDPPAGGESVARRSGGLTPHGLADGTGSCRALLPGQSSLVLASRRRAATCGGATRGHGSRSSNVAGGREAVEARGRRARVRERGSRRGRGSASARSSARSGSVARLRRCGDRGGGDSGPPRRRPCARAAFRRRDADLEARDATRELALVVRLDDEMEVVDLDREVDDPKGFVLLGLASSRASSRLRWARSACLMTRPSTRCASTGRIGASAQRHARDVSR